MRLTRCCLVGLSAASLFLAVGAGCKSQAPVVDADVASVSKAVQQNLGSVKKCWKSIPERFAAETQTLRFEVHQGKSRVSFVNPDEDAHPLGKCIKHKLSVIRFGAAVTATIDVPVRLSERPAASAGVKSQPKAAPKGAANSGPASQPDKE